MLETSMYGLASVPLPIGRCALYCDSSIAFADGTVWENPDYTAWLDTYLETAVDPSTLEAYYPFVQTVETAP